MKTTLHLHRTAPPPTHRRHHVRSSTLRLGLVLSLVAAVLAIVVEAVVHLPAILILIPVVVVGFALSLARQRPRGRARRRRLTPAARPPPRRAWDDAAMKVRIGVGLACGRSSTARSSGTFVDTVERLRFDSLWLSERITGEAPDPVVAMSYAAGRTTRLKFGMSVLVLPGRNPVVLAKEMATLAIMSGGRLLPAFGLGVADGMEHQAFGVGARRAGEVVRRGADRDAQVLVRRRRRPRRRALPLRGPAGAPAAQAPRRLARRHRPVRAASASGGWPTAGCRRSSRPPTPPPAGPSSSRSPPSTSGRSRTTTTAC